MFHFCHCFAPNKRYHLNCAPCMVHGFDSCFLVWNTHGCNTWTLQWRHNGRDSVSNHQPRECLLIRLIRQDQRKHQSSASLAFVRGIHRRPVNSPHKGPVMRKMFPFDDVIMEYSIYRYILPPHRTYLNHVYVITLLGDILIFHSIR